MKVFIVSFSLKRGGAAIAAEKFSKLLCSGFNVHTTIVTADSESDKRSLGFMVHFFKRLVSFSLVKLMHDGNPVKHSLNIFSSRSLVKILGAENKHPDADLVWNFHWVNNDMLSVSRLFSIPKGSVITLHDEWLYCGAEHYANVISRDDSYCVGYSFFQKGVWGVNWNYIIWRLKKRALNKRNDIIFTAPSSWMLERARSSLVLRGKDIRLLPNPVPTDIFTPAELEEKTSLRSTHGLSDDDILLCIGSVKGSKNPLKGYDLLQKSLQSLSVLLPAKVASRICLVFFGSGEYVKGSRYGFRMINVGKLNGAHDMRNLYAMCDWALVPSKVESFGQVAAESIACETPVVAFDISGLKDVVVSGVSGLLAEPFCYENYAKCIVRGILMSKTDYQNLKSSGREHIETNFSDSVIKNSYFEILKDAHVRKQEFMKSGEHG